MTKQPMIKTNFKQSLLALALAGIGLGFAAGIAPTQAAERVLTEEEIAEATYMREEEKVARDVYLTLAEYWYPVEGNSAVVTSLINIAASEQTHMDTMEDILEKYDIPDPVDENETSGVFTNPDLQDLHTQLVALGQATSFDALLVGGLIEETDIKDIQESIEVTTAKDIIKVYERLMCGSRNHLRSFAGHIAATQGSYVAQVLPQEEVDAIIASPMETCGK